MGRDGSKTGGRPKGSVNKLREPLRERAEALGINPFEILLLFAAGRWKPLGYKKATRTIVTNLEQKVEVEVISPELRAQCAKEAAQYLDPKLRSVEFKGDALPIGFVFQLGDEDDHSDDQDAELDSASKKNRPVD